MAAGRWLVCGLAFLGIVACDDDAASKGEDIDAAASCVEGTNKCIAGRKATCQGDGTWLAENCDVGQICDEGECRADIDCRPGERQCQDNAYIVCGDEGWGAPEPCGEAATCQNGVCLPHNCVPGSYACLNGSTVVCSENGLNYQPADDHNACTSDLALVEEALPEAELGEPYSYRFKASGGTTPYAWDLTQGAFPAGLSLDEAGVLSGTPEQEGSFSFRVTVTDADGFEKTALYTLAVQSASAQAFTITSTMLDAAEAGSEYLYQLTAQGGTTPYAWSKVSGALPAGLNLTSEGAITGIPTEIGAFSFKVRAFDAATPPSYADADLSLTVDVAPLEVTGDRSINLLGTTAVLLSTVIELVPYSTELQAKGGVEPYTWTQGSVNGALSAVLALMGGNGGIGLPSGLTLASNGTLSGWPTSLESAFSISLGSISLSGYIFQAQVCDSQPTPDCASAVYLIPTTEIDLGGLLGGGGSSSGEGGSSSGEGGFDLSELLEGLLGGGSSSGEGGSSDGDGGFDLSELLEGLLGGGSSDGDDDSSDGDDDSPSTDELAALLEGLFGQP